MSTNLQQVYWFASRSFGITAMILLAASVGLGLTMSGRMLRRPGSAAQLRHAHESLTLVTIAMIAVHAGLLLADPYLRPGLAGITVPFVMDYRPVFTGIGILAGWLAVLFGLSFYARRQIGVARWRFIHRFTILVYLLALVHVAGAGTDARRPWMLALLTALTAPVVFGFAYRMLPAGPRAGTGPTRAAPVTSADRGTG